MQQNLQGPLAWQRRDTTSKYGINILKCFVRNKIPPKWRELNYWYGPPIWGGKDYTSLCWKCTFPIQMVTTSCNRMNQKNMQKEKERGNDKIVHLEILIANSFCGPFCAK